MSTDKECTLIGAYQDAMLKLELARRKAANIESNKALELFGATQVIFSGLAQHVHVAARTIETQQRLCAAMQERIDELTAENVKLHAVADDIIRLWQQRGQQPPAVKTE